MKNCNVIASQDRLIIRNIKTIDCMSVRYHLFVDIYFVQPSAGAAAKP